MDSALYYQGAIVTEPACLSIDTRRTDRSLINLNFPVNRHYFSKKNFEIGLKKKKMEFGCYYIYDMERSACDVMRLESGNIEGVITEIYRNEHQYKRLLEYARLLRIKGVKQKHAVLSHFRGKKSHIFFSNDCRGEIKHKLGAAIFHINIGKMYRKFWGFWRRKSRNFLTYLTEFETEK